MADDRLVPSHYADDIEASLFPGKPGTPQILAGSEEQVFALVCIDGAFGRVDLLAGPRLDLYEHQNIALPGHQVEFTVAAPPPVVAAHHGKAFALQVAMGQVLRPSTPGVLAIPPLQTHAMARVIECLRQLFPVRIRSPCRESRSRGSAPRTSGIVGKLLTSSSNPSYLQKLSSFTRTDLSRNRTVGIIAEPGVILAEISEGVAVQMPAVGGIAERAEVGVVRRDDVELPAGAQAAGETPPRYGSRPRRAR